MEQSQTPGVRAALLKQLIKAIGTNRVKGVHVEEISMHPPEKDDPALGAADDMTDAMEHPAGPDDDIEELLKEARAARALKAGKK